MMLEEELNYRYKEQLNKLKSYLTVETAMLLFKYDSASIIDNETLKIFYVKNTGIYFLQKVPELKRWLYWSGFLYNPITKTINELFCSINNGTYSVSWSDRTFLGESGFKTCYLNYTNKTIGDSESISLGAYEIIARNTIRDNKHDQDKRMFTEIDIQQELHLTTIDLNHIIITYFEKYGEIDTFITRYLDKLRPNKTKYRINLNTSKRQKKPRPKKK